MNGQCHQQRNKPKHRNSVFSIQLNYNVSKLFSLVRQLYFWICMWWIYFFSLFYLFFLHSHSLSHTFTVSDPVSLLGLCGLINLFLFQLFGEYILYPWVRVLSVLQCISFGVIYIILKFENEKHFNVNTLFVVISITVWKLLFSGCKRFFCFFFFLRSFADFNVFRSHLK